MKILTPNNGKQAIEGLPVGQAALLNILFDVDELMKCGLSKTANTTIRAVQAMVRKKGVDELAVAINYRHGFQGYACDFYGFVHGDFVYED